MFQLLIVYLYSGGQLEVMAECSLSQQMELAQAALRFGLNTLKSEVIKSMKMLIHNTTVAEMLSFATVSLFTFCEFHFQSLIFEYNH